MVTTNQIVASPNLTRTCNYTKLLCEYHVYNFIFFVLCVRSLSLSVFLLFLLVVFWRFLPKDYDITTCSSFCTFWLYPNLGDTRTTNVCDIINHVVLAHAYFFVPLFFISSVQSFRRFTCMALTRSNSPFRRFCFLGNWAKSMNTKPFRERIKFKTGYISRCRFIACDKSPIAWIILLLVSR